MPTAARLPLPAKPIKAKDTTIRQPQTVAEGVNVETTYLIVYCLCTTVSESIRIVRVLILLSKLSLQFEAEWHASTANNVTTANTDVHR